MGFVDGMSDSIDACLARWNLRAEGAPVVTHSSTLLPVTGDRGPAMIKIARDPDERRGGAVMEWWAGQGAARVLARHGAAILMERATGPASLIRMAQEGRDDDACAILCRAAGQLHGHRGRPDFALPGLADWFRDLFAGAERYGGILPRSAATAAALLADPRDMVVLHGDLHHGNVLDFGPRGWLAIDPKGLWGERAFDFANIFSDPDLSDPSVPVAADPARFERRVGLIAAAARVERVRLLQWVLAFSGLSAVWFLDDGDGDDLARVPLRIAELAAVMLDR